jgi:hypothetical protein
MSTTTTELEIEAEQTRRRVSGLMDELKARIAPDKVVEEVMDYAATGLRGAANEVARNIADKAQRNPLPFLLIGAGIAWMIASERRRRAGGDAMPAAGMPHGADSMPRPQSAPESPSIADRGLRQVASAASGAVESASGGLHAVTDKAKAGLGRAEEFAAGTYVGAQHAAESAANAGQSAMVKARDLVEQQPLVAAGVGLAIGAALGAAFPTTEPENRLMGATADEAKTLAREGVSEGAERVKTAAEHVVDAVTDTISEEARKQGLMPKKNEESWPSPQGAAREGSNGTARIDRGPQAG